MVGIKDLHTFGSPKSKSAVLEYYQLREQPFGDTADPRYFYLTPTHRRTLATLFYHLEKAEGFLAITGAPGVGKTLLLQLLLRRLKHSARTSFVFHTMCDANGFLHHLRTDLGIDTASRDLALVQKQLRELIDEEALAGRRFLWVIDEAHGLNAAGLELIGQLADSPESKASSAQILLAGLPLLADQLTRMAFTSSKEQPWILAPLDRLGSADSDGYIDHRLRVAGYRGSGLFTSDAREVIARCSQGVPREINKVCFNAMFRGYWRKRESIDAAIVTDAVAHLLPDSSVAKLDRLVIDERFTRDAKVERPDQGAPRTPPARRRT